MLQASMLTESPASSSPFCFQDHPIRTRIDNDQLWFVAKDVCAALDISLSGVTFRGFPKDWQGMMKFITPSGNQPFKVITEPAVYKLAFRSNKPEADAFTNWVASEVIPAIRNTGKFEAPAAQPALPSTVTPSTAADRRPLDKLVKVWAQQSGTVHAQAWTQVNAHFNLDSVAQLPVEWIPDAIAFVEGKINALATIEAKPKPAALPPSSVPATRGRHRVKSSTEEQLSELLDEAYHLRDARIEFNKLFDKLSVITGPLYKQALASMRRTDDNVCTDSLIQTLHYHRWDANESIRDAANAAMEACRSAIVVARLLGA